MMIVPRAVSNLSWIAAIPLICLALEFLISRSDGRAVHRFKNQYGYFYLISGFAMIYEKDYNAVYRNSGCLCRQRCFMDPLCHSVSIIHVNSSSVECRLSAKPTNTSKAADRPHLKRLSKSLHFLEARENNWNEPEADGWFYRLAASPWVSAEERCQAMNPLHRFALLRTHTQFEVAKTFADSEGLNIFLSYRVEDKEPKFGGMNRSIQYSNTGLSNDLLSELDFELDCPSMMLVKRKNESYKFLCTSGETSRPTLCQRNPLFLGWLNW